MDNFKFGIFDIFSATIPGIPVTLILSFLVNFEPFAMESVTSSINGFNLNSILILFVISYVIGFATQYPSYELFKLIIEKTKIWKKRVKNYPVSLGKRGEELCKIREMSIENYKILNVFMALRAMCYNLAFNLILFVILLIPLNVIKGYYAFDAIIIVLLSVVFSIIFFRRAVGFHEWSHHLITDSMKFIKSNKN